MTRFCCTYGRGTFPFVSEELAAIGASEIQDEDGKVFFSISADTEDERRRVFDLKTVERLFYVCQLRKIPTAASSEVIAAIGEILQALPWAEMLDAYATLFLRSGSSGAGDATSSKKRRAERLYRLSVKLRPKFLIKFRQEVLEKARSAVSEVPDWTYSTKDFDTEISIHLNHDNLFVGIPLTREPLSKRSYLKHIGLRSTISYVIGQKVQAQGPLLLDPMCGCGTILCEAARLRPAFCVGLERDWGRAVAAKENAELTARVEVLCADAERPPLRAGIFDAICCDLPFGKKHSRGERLASCYRRWLTAWRSLLHVPFSLAFLTTPELLPDLQAILQELQPSGNLCEHEVNLGRTRACLVTSREEKEQQESVGEELKESV